VVPLKSCIVSYTDCDCKRSVEVMAETLNEAAVLGLKAMNVPGERLHLLSLELLVKSPQVCHSISGASPKDKNNPADYPLTAHVISFVRTVNNTSFTGTSGGTPINGDIDSSSVSVQFRIGDLLYTCGFGCRKHVQVGTDVHARVQKNKLYILTDDGQTCDSHIRGVQEISKE
jgi:hypothetical protein